MADPGVRGESLTSEVGLPETSQQHADDKAPQQNKDAGASQQLAPICYYNERGHIALYCLQKEANTSEGLLQRCVECLHCQTYLGLSWNLISKLMANKNPALSSYYGNLIINVAKKNVLKIHPEIKRQVCKKCRCILIPTVSAKIKLKSFKKSKIIEWTCNTCGAKRRFPVDIDKDHRVWVEKPEAVVEVIN